MKTWSACLWTCLLLAWTLPATAIVPAAGWDPWSQALDKAADPVALSDIMARLQVQARPLLTDCSRAVQRARIDGLKAPGSLAAVAILVDFADTCFYGREDEFTGPLPTSGQSDFYYAAHDALYYDHLLHDVGDFFDAASAGRFDLDYAVHPTILGLDEGMAHYGNHPENGEQSVLLAADAIARLDAEIDFSLYDTVLLIHAGAGEETDVLDDSPEQIYSTYLGPEDFVTAMEDSILDQPYIPTDDFPVGEGVRHVLILPEIQFQDAFPGFSGKYGSLGTYCFEVGLRLGMLSLTDFTPSGSPDSQGIGQFGLMGYGLFTAGGFIPPQPCAFNKLLMGWLDPQPVDPASAATWTLHPSEFPDHPEAAARVDLTGSEYFLLEYRLQDPDGNVIFSFDGDLNGNNTPDFYDTSNAENGGRPAGFFDPAEDIREWLTGAEWDFFVSDNDAREDGVKGAGSGLYVWHIDEGVIRDAFAQERNVFNADPSRKSVDLEEADGIQDLDTREPSLFWLGGDDDSFRAEDNAVFGPDTRPDTRTNGGVRTGLVLDEISAVVVDSVHVFDAGTPDERTGIRYAETMTFRCRRDTDPFGVAIRTASRDLSGVDLTGSHLLAAPLAGGAQSEQVIVAAADSGRVYALDFDLLEWVDHDGDPATVEPLTVGTDDAGAPVTWFLPVCAGQVDTDDAGLEIVLSSPSGVYAFDQIGAPLAEGPGGTARGRIADVTAVSAPILLPWGSGEADLDPAVICVGTVNTEVVGAPTMLRFLDATGAEVHPAVSLGGAIQGTPVRLDRMLYVPVIAPNATGALAAVTWPTSGDPALAWSVPLDLLPADVPPLVTANAVVVRDVDGRAQTVSITGVDPVVEPLWPADIVVGTAMGPGGTFIGNGRFGRSGPEAAWLLGWPRRPLPAIQVGQAQPLALGLDTAPTGFLFASRDGRLFLCGADGAVRPGWPIAGPADAMATPVLVEPWDSVEGLATLMLAAAGTTPVVTGVDADAEALQTRAVAHLQVFQIGVPSEYSLARGASMYGGGPWRGAVGIYDGTAPADDVSLEDTHVCYPQPLTDAELHVRGRAPETGGARVVVVNLQGEVVRDSGTLAVDGGAVFEFVIDVASGVYLCKLQAGGRTSVQTIAVAH